MIERFTSPGARAGCTDATRDLPTGTLSRHGLVALIERIGGNARRGSHVTLLMVNISGLASVDTHYGRQAGDQVRATIAQRLRLLVAPHDNVARVAQDTFACALCHDAGAPFAIEMVRDMLAAVALPVDVPGGKAMVRGAVGIATASADLLTAERLFAAARVAMEWIMARGASGHCVYEPGMAPAGFPDAIDEERATVFARCGFG